MTLTVAPRYQPGYPIKTAEVAVAKKHQRPAVDNPYLLRPPYAYLHTPTVCAALLGRRLLPYYCLHRVHIYAYLRICVCTYVQNFLKNWDVAPDLPESKGKIVDAPKSALGAWRKRLLADVGRALGISASWEVLSK